MIWGWDLPEWNGALGWILFGSVVMFFGSLALLPVIIVRMPHDYFTRKHEPGEVGGGVGWLFLRLVKNVLGVVIAMLGVLLIFTPGQGLLSILLGLILIDFPGKHAVVRRILRNGRVVAAANRWRAKFGKPALEHPNHD